MGESDHRRIAERLEHEAEKMEHHAEELQTQIDDIRGDWRRKRTDPGVPGAPEPPSETEDS